MEYFLNEEIYNHIVNNTATRESVDAISDTVSGIADDVAGIDSEIEEIQDDIAETVRVVSGISGDITALQSDQATMQTAINNRLIKPQTAGTNGQVLTSDGQGGQSWQTPAAGGVTDVKMTGTSVVTNGVANIRVAYGNSEAGIVKGVTDWGVTVRPDDTGRLQIAGATPAQIKEGTHNYRPLTPSSQPGSTFYGLAAAAGDTTQKASSNAIGTYTADAKTAIRSMLGIKTKSFTATVNSAYGIVAGNQAGIPNTAWIISAKSLVRGVVITPYIQPSQNAWAFECINPVNGNPIDLNDTFTMDIMYIE